MSFRIPVARRRATAAVLRRMARAEAIAVEEQLALLAHVRREILAAITQAAGYQSFHLTMLLQSVNQEIGAGQAKAQQLVALAAGKAWAAGSAAVDSVTAGLGVPESLSGITPQLLHSFAELMRDQVRDVWRSLGSRLKTSIRRAVIGIDNPDETMARVARAIKGSVFDQASNSAERIVRDNMGRVFSHATQARLRDSAKHLPGLKKYWLNAHDNRVRPTHEQAGRDYEPGGNVGPIPVDQPFIVGGSKLMQPHDPTAPIEETANCRCVSVPYVEDVSLPTDLPRAS